MISRYGSIFFFVKAVSVNTLKQHLESNQGPKTQRVMDHNHQTMLFSIKSLSAIPWTRRRFAWFWAICNALI